MNNRLKMSVCGTVRARVRSYTSSAVPSARPSNVDFVWFNHQSHATYLDHGQIYTAWFASLSKPDRDQSAGGPLLSALVCPKKSRAHQGNNKGKTKETTSLLLRRGHEGGSGEELSSPSARTRLAFSVLSTSLLPLPKLPLRRLALDVSLLFSRFRARFPTSVVDRRSRIARPYRPSAKRSLILNRSSPVPVFLRASAHRILLGLPVGAVLEEVLPSLSPIWASPAPRGGPILSPLHYCPVRL